MSKLDETQEQVAQMSDVCEKKKVVVFQAKQDAEELLVQIIQDKRIADDQEKTVNAEAQKIGLEAQEANSIADQVIEKTSHVLDTLTQKSNDAPIHYVNILRDTL